jgi:hypothetical protein
MLFLLKLNNRNCGKMLTTTSVLLALLPALAVVTPVVRAQDWDHINGRDKVHDPTGAWLIRTPLPTGPEGKPGAFFLTVFHKGGTLTENIQGESAFDPAATNPPNPPFNILTSPQSGVWQKTGWNTFAATWLAMQYQIRTDHPDSPLYRFDKMQYTGKLSETGDQMEISAVLTFFDADGKQLNPDGNPGTESIPFKANGTRIPLDLSPNTTHSLPIPSIPTMPMP